MVTLTGRLTVNSQNWTGSENGHFDWQNDCELLELDRVTKIPKALLESLYSAWFYARSRDTKSRTTLTIFPMGPSTTSIFAQLSALARGAMAVRPYTIQNKYLVGSLRDIASTRYDSARRQDLWVLVCTAVSTNIAGASLAPEILG